MPHDHAHAHVTGDRPLIVAVTVNLALTVAQIAGGIAAGSMALIADGVHNLSDALSLILAFGARKLARRGPTPGYSFGMRRAEVVAALVNFTTLVVIALWLAAEALGRLADPPPVAGGLVMALAGLALVVDIATAALTFRLAQGSLNIRAAFLHNLADAGASVAVLLGGVLIWAFGWYWADPVMTLVISGAILWHVAGDLPAVWRILMLGAPRRLDATAVAARLTAHPGVRALHGLHLWQIDETTAALQAHLVIDPDADPATLLRDLKAMLAAEHDIALTTFEIETEGSPCAGGLLGAHDHAHP